MKTINDTLTIDNHQLMNSWTIIIQLELYPEIIGV